MSTFTLGCGYICLYMFVFVHACVVMCVWGGKLMQGVLIREENVDMGAVRPQGRTGSCGIRSTVLWGRGLERWLGS